MIDFFHADFNCTKHLTFIKNVSGWGRGCVHQQHFKSLGWPQESTQQSFKLGKGGSQGGKRGFKGQRNHQEEVFSFKYQVPFSYLADFYTHWNEKSPWDSFLP